MDQIKVLIIDDDQTDRSVCRQYLQNGASGTFVFHEESSGLSGLRACESFDADCILLDYRLPDMDGLSVLRQLRDDSGAPRYPVVMLTAIGSEQVAVEAMKLGLMDYVAKNSVGLGLLPRTIENAIRKFRLERKIALQRAELEQRNADLEAAQEDILREKEKYRNLTEAIPQLVWSASHAGLVHFANKRFLEYSGRNYNSSWPFASLVHPEDLASFQEAWSAAAESGGVMETEARLKRDTDGTFRWHLVRAVPLVGIDGRVDDWLGTCTDIENQKRNEEAVRQQQKFESIGLLAGGIAHDFNNLLVGIMGGASFAIHTTEPTHAAYPMLEVVLKASKRAAHLVQQLLAYAGKGTIIEEPVNISQLVEETRALLHASISASVVLDLQLDSEVPPIKINQGQLQQLIMNLIINGGEAVGEKDGRVIVRTYLQEVDRAQDYYNALGYVITPGRYVGLQVTDTGCGMDDKTRAKIFEPFFTTKFTGRGLGLAAVQGIVRSQHGLIDVSSVPGEGSVFTVLLPAMTTPATVTPKAPEAAAQPGGQLILVIDDEEMVGCTVKAALEKSGYNVIVAEDGTKGMAAYRRHRGELGLVLLDLGMPGKSGLEVLREVREIDDRIPVLISSGFSEDEVARRLEGMHFSGIIRKPFMISNLIETVSKILAPRSSTSASHG